MKDVAAHASVSIMTVSNVINGRSGTVGEKTRRRVERAMDQLGYQPNLAARALRAARADTVAFLLRDESREYLADPLTNLYLTGVGDVLREHDLSLLIQTVRPDAPPAALLDPIRGRKADGACVLLSGEPELRTWYVEQLAELGKPFVVLDEVLDQSSVLSVRAADRDGGRMITKHLLDKGHVNIGFIGAAVPWAVVEQRRLGYADALRAAGLPVDEQPKMFEADWQPADGAMMTRKLMEQNPYTTAILCGSDALAIGAIQALLAMGYGVPDDVAVAGFDDFQFSAWVRPAVTTVRLPAYDMGRVAARMLLSEIQGETLDARQLVLPVELIIRESA